MHLVNFYLNVSTAPICFVFVDVKIMETSHDDLGFCEDVTGSPVGQLSIKKKKKSRILVASRPRETEEKLLLSPLLPASPRGL